MKTFRESQMGRKKNPKSQGNNRQKHAFLQFPLLQIREKTWLINNVRIFNRGLNI